MHTTSQKTISSLLLTKSWDGEFLAPHLQALMIPWRIGRIECKRYQFRRVAKLLSHHAESQQRLLSYQPMREFLSDLNFLLNLKIRCQNHSGCLCWMNH